MAILVQFVDEEWKLEQRLVCMQVLTESMTGEEVPRELISVLSTRYGVKSELLLAATRDQTLVNNLAMQTIKVVYLLIVDIGCFSHTLDHVGDNFITPNLKEFLHLWISLFSHSPKTGVLWRSQVGQSMVSWQ